MSRDKSVHEMLQESISWRKGFLDLRTTLNGAFRDDTLRVSRQIREALMSAVNVSEMLGQSMRGSASEVMKNYIDLRRTLFENTDNLRTLMKSAMPHISLYSQIIEAVDEETYKKISDLWEEDNQGENFIDDIDMDVDIDIKRPYFYVAAVNLNIYKNVTEVYMDENKATKEEVAQWKKYIVPILVFLMDLFMNWAMSDTPIRDMNLVKQMSVIVETINEHVLEEEIDLEIIDDKTHDLNKTDIKESFLG